MNRHVSHIFCYFYLASSRGPSALCFSWLYHRKKGVRMNRILAEKRASWFIRFKQFVLLKTASNDHSWYILCLQLQFTKSQICCRTYQKRGLPKPRHFYTLKSQARGEWIEISNCLLLVYYFFLCLKTMAWVMRNEVGLIIMFNNNTR